MRERRVDDWAKEAAKHKRNLGEEYVSYSTKKVVKARQVGPPCPDGCFDKPGRDNIDTIFTNFWAIGDYSTQNGYLQVFIGAVPAKRKRTEAESFYHTVFTRDYNIVFRAPLTDVCITCEKLETQIFSLQKDGQGTSDVKNTLREDKAIAQVPRDLLHQAKQGGPGNGVVKMVAIDLQQTLPCPRLRASNAYYKRKLVDFIFMKSGHSYLPCDRTFGSIEKKLRKTSHIYSPLQYIPIIGKAVKKGFPVIVMQR
ncbi:hypothetical protein Hamer_G006447 [Homarus americanus]|uniref:Uncharacterized protein n=1 Tax=Homarus americanus TaxID=6706 RepID=A0A8J5MM46_HOMAM|nr:hypothetical protein Hamer_G006447 [Homarus americanus]